MHDQADELRQLVLQAARRGSLPAAPAPRFVVMSGGKGGVGTTTIAVHLAAALARCGCRPILIDADLRGGDVATLSGLDGHQNIADVLSGRLTLHEVLQRGPAGVQVLPGAWGQDIGRICTPASQQRLVDELRDLGRYADAVLIDAGNGISEVAGRFWQLADLVLLVTTPEPSALMDAYASVKVLGKEVRGKVLTLVNRATDRQEALQVHSRIAQACSRFLNLSAGTAGFLEDSPEIAHCGRSQQGWGLPPGRALHGFETLAETLLPYLQPASSSPTRVAEASAAAA